MLVELLLDANRRVPKVLAVDDGLAPLTYHRMTLAAAAMKGIIESTSDRPHIGIMLPASAAFPAAFFGTLWAGRVAVPLNFLLAPEELKALVADAELDVVFTVKPLAERLAGAPARLVFLEDLWLKWRVILGMLRTVPAPPGAKADDLAVILYTSGTTAEPKGVELTHGNLHSNATDAIASLSLLSRHRFLNVLPPFHVFGLTGCVIVPVAMGGTVYAIPRFNPVAAVRLIAEQQLSVMMAIPSMYAAMLRTKSATAESFRSVEYAISGGEPLPESVAQPFLQRFGVELRQGYGLTETSPIVSCNSMMESRAGTVGRPIRNVQVRIVDADGVDVPAGADGEIIIRGPGVMRGYHRKPERTAQVIDRDGWFHSGDLGRFDADGFLSITGRIKDLIIIGGENVLPREIEAVLEEHPSVLQAAVIGVPDASRGEAPVAFVTCRDGMQVTESELRQFARKSLAGYKVPRQVIVREDLPTSPTGKVMKRKLHELLQ